MNRFRLSLPKPKNWPPPSDPQTIALLTAYPRLRDPIGHQLHTVVAMVHFFTLPLHGVASGISFGVLFLLTVLRWNHVRRCWTPMLRSPLTWLMFAWAAWSTLSLTWSTDTGQGLDELASLRVLLTPLLLWPIMDRAPWFIGAALAGVLAQNLVQLGQYAHVLGLKPGVEDRLGGFLHPIKTAAWCAAAACWHLSATMHARGAWRWGSLVLAFCSVVGMLATGSRGPWLAAAVALPLTVLVIAARRKDTRRTAVILVLIGMTAAGAGWLLVRDRLSERIHDAFTELQEPDEQDSLLTSTGLRLQMWEWAWRFFENSPVLGIGVGSYSEAVQQSPEFLAAAEEHPERREKIARDHPHSTYLYALACLGVIGGMILLAWLSILVVRCWRDPPDHLYADGSLGVLVTWLIGAQFDCYNLNGEEFGLLALLVSVTMYGRPRSRLQRSADDDLAEYTARVAGSSGSHG